MLARFEGLTGFVAEKASLLKPVLRNSGYHMPTERPLYS
jgi:hypothetical protein